MQEPIPTFDADGVRAQLRAQSPPWPETLQELLIKRMRETPIRFFLCENNSRTMHINTGQRTLTRTDGVAVVYKNVRCTRWAELGDFVGFHAALALRAGAVSEFHMTCRSGGGDDDCHPIVVGQNRDDPATYLELMRRMNAPPSGDVCELREQILEITERVQAMAEQLAAKKQRAVVVLAADRTEFTDAEKDAIQALAKLPVVKFLIRVIGHDYTKITSTLGWMNDDSMPMHTSILCSAFVDARFVNAVNPWFTYTDALHRLRECGVYSDDFRGLKYEPWSLDCIHALVATL